MRAVEDMSFNGNHGGNTAMQFLQSATPAEVRPVIADSAEAQAEKDNQPQGMSIQENVTTGVAMDTGFSIFDLATSSVAPGFNMGIVATVAGVAADAREEHSYQLAMQQNAMTGQNNIQMNIAPKNEQVVPMRAFDLLGKAQYELPAPKPAMEMGQSQQAAPAPRLYADKPSLAA